MISLATPAETPLTGIDDLLKLHKSLINTHLKADAALSEAVRHAEEAFADQYEYQALLKQNIQQEIVESISAASLKTKSFFDSTIASMDAAVQGWLSALTSSTRVMKDDIDGLWHVSPELLAFMRSLGLR